MTFAQFACSAVLKGSLRHRSCGLPQRSTTKLGFSRFLTAARPSLRELGSFSCLRGQYEDPTGKFPQAGCRLIFTALCSIAFKQSRIVRLGMCGVLAVRLFETVHAASANVVGSQRSIVDHRLCITFPIHPHLF